MAKRTLHPKTKRILAARGYLTQAAKFYDDAQPRDESGRWTDGGGGSSGGSSAQAPGGGKASRAAAYKEKETLTKNVERIMAQPPNYGTREIYQDPKTGDYEDARQEFHQDIIEDYLKDGSTNLGTSYFMGGAPATGKSSIINSGDVTLPEGILVLDADRIKGYLPEYEQMVSNRVQEAAARAHEESSTISKQIVNQAVNQKWDLVLDGVGDGSYEGMKAKVDQQRELGKRVVANYVTTDTEVSVERAKSRGERTGRVVPESYIRSMHKEISRLVPRMAEEGLFDELKLFDNNSGSPKLIFEQNGKNIKVHDQDAYNKFLAKGK